MSQTEVIKSGVGRPSREVIESLLSEYESSGFSLGEYCEYKGINAATLEGWLQRYRSKEISKGYVEVTIPDLEEGSLFAEVRGIKLYQRVEATYLKELIN